MFGFEDTSIAMVYLLAFLTVIFACGFGAYYWNEEDAEDIITEKDKEEAP